jgi:hypothetical protein
MILAFILAMLSLVLLGLWGLLVLEEKGREVVTQRGVGLVRKEVLP